MFIIWKAQNWKLKKLNATQKPSLSDIQEKHKGMFASQITTDITGSEITTSCLHHEIPVDLVRGKSPQITKTDDLAGLNPCDLWAGSKRALR